MLTGWRRLGPRLERLSDRPWARLLLAALLVTAGVVLGLSWNAAQGLLVDQSDQVTAACQRSAAVARELAADGTCETAREVTAQRVIGPTGPAGAQGATGGVGATGRPGPPGRDGSNSTRPGPTGAQGEPGAVGRPGRDSVVPGATGPRGATGADSTVPGPQGAQGRPGRDGEDGADSTVPGPRGATGATGPRGTPGPTCPEGTVLAPVTFASGQDGLGCVSGG